MFVILFGQVALSVDASLGVNETIIVSQCKLHQCVYSSYFLNVILMISRIIVAVRFSLRHERGPTRIEQVPNIFQELLPGRFARHTGALSVKELASGKVLYE